MDAVAVINYPGHFLSTLVTIKNLHDITDWNVPYYIFIDDLGQSWEHWPNYLDDLKQALTNFDTEFHFVLFSQFQFGKIWDGWLRQQLVKLNVDQFLPGELWYVTDGDVILDEVLGLDVVPYSYATNPTNPININQGEYIKYMLKTDDVQLHLPDGTPVCTHHAPFRWIHKQDLIGLRAYIKSFNNLHVKLMKENIINAGSGMSMTEWDLLEIWKQQIDNQKLNLQIIEFETFFGTDRDRPYEFYEKYVTINNNIKERISAIYRE